MHLPYKRPRLIEIHEQPWCPPTLRRPIQDMLTFMWTHRIRPFQSRAPYEAVADILEGIYDEIESEDKVLGDESESRLGIVDCCSGAGGPMPMVERAINSRRKQQGRMPVTVLLSDLHPHVEAWERQTSRSISKSLSYLPYPVDATNSPSALKKERHLRTFCLAFHHFGEDGARRVLEDAMRTSEGICIFELQEPDFGSIFSVLALFPLTWIFTPFQRPSLPTLFFTYVVPLIPTILVLDGFISAWRTRSFDHLLYLANLAAMSVSLEGGDRDGCGEVEWKWETGRRMHTRPFGNMVWVVGRRDRGVGGARAE